MKKLILTGLCLAFYFNSHAQWTNPALNAALNNTNNGNVGIGLSLFTPAQPLSILTKGGGTNNGASVTDFDFGIIGSPDANSNTLQLLGLANTNGGYGSLQVLKSNGVFKNLILQGQGGLTGVGDFNPASALSIANTSAKTLGLYRWATSGAIGSGATEGRITFGVYGIASGSNAVSGTEYDGGAISAIATQVWNPGSAQGTALVFYNIANSTANFSERMRIDQNGNIGIGTTSPDQKLSVIGTVHAQSVIVDMSQAPDYVFNKDYSLPALADVKTYLTKNHHLKEIPSAAEMEEHGMNLGEMNKLLLKKIEEITLYMIKQREDSDKNFQLQRRQIMVLNRKIKSYQKTASIKK